MNIKIEKKLRKNPEENNNMRLGVMGGVFDPIHIGHLFTAEEARIKLKLEKVIFVPCLQPSHKRNGLVTGIEHRLKMTYLAVEDNPFFQVSEIEVNRSGPSYTVDTIREFREIYGWEVDIFFITGADAFLEIDTWFKKDELLKMCQFVAATRPGYDLNKLDSNFKDNLEIMEIPALAISSTDIRNRVRNNQSIKYIVLDIVRDYIYKNNLYASNNI